MAGAGAAAEIAIKLEPGDRVAWFGIVRRFNDDGTLARPVDPKATFDRPYCDRRIEGFGGRIDGLKPGIYDLIVFLKDGTRLEGFHWPVFGEFDDPRDAAFSRRPPEEVESLIKDQIAQTAYYENKVTPLAFAGNDERVRVLMQLLRDKPTSFDAEYGAPVATLRYEIWQFTNHFGGWTRDKQSKVLHRILEAKAKTHRRTWLWDRALGGIRLADRQPAGNIRYEIPADLSKLPGLRPREQ